MSTKIITFDDHFATGEPTVQLVATRGRDGRALREATSLHKIASTKSPALEYIKNVEPEPGKTTVLVIGLGDSETYGSNRNGDAFPSEPVPGKIASDEVLSKHYQSYDNAHVFEHHVNNDPRKAIGRVKKAFWNPYMRRVEVLEDFEHARAPHMLEKIAAGEYPSKSMGCFCAGARVHTPAGRKLIEDIAVGDLVLTHTGASQEVTELHRRYYEGALYTVLTSNGRSTATAEHPYAVLPQENVEEWVKSKGYFRRRAFADIDTAHVHWVPAASLEAGMYVLTPFDTQTAETLTVDQCRLLGYYAAEGNLQDGTSKSVAFSHHIADALRDEVPLLAARLGVTRWTQRGHHNSDLCMITQLRSKDLFTLCNAHVGRRAAEKRLSLELMRQPLEQQLAFLGAVINGDGGTDEKDDFYIATCNEELAHQYQHMGFRCGLYSRVQMIRHKPSTVVFKETVEYRVSFSRAGNNIIAPYTAKVSPRELQSASTGALLGPGFVISKITDTVRLQFSGLVYNFEVEGDNSYVVGNHAVHNCRIKYDVCTICGNKAKTRKDYCDHLKFEMSKVLPDGRKIAALNPSPEFFDSSWVIRPADRTGFMLKKVAFDAPYNIRSSSFELGELVEGLREKAAAASKAAAMEKVISGEPTATSSGFDNGSLKLLKRYSDEVAPNEAKKLPGLSSEGVKITIEYSPDEAIGTTDAMGLPMGLKDLIQFFMGRLGSEPAKPEELDAVSKQASVVFDIFAAYPRFFDDMVKAANLEEPKVNTKVANHVWPQAYNTLDRNLEDSSLYDRRVTSSLTSAQTPNTDVVSYTDPAMNTHVSNMGLARRATESLANDAQVSKGVRGAGYLGMGTLLGAAATGALLGKGGRSPLRRLTGGALGGAAAVTAGKGIHEAVRPVRLSDLNAPMLLSNEGQLIPATTEMSYQKKGSVGHTPWNPEMLYTTLRHADGGARAVAPAVKTALFASLVPCEIWDESASILGPTLDMSKVAMLLEDTLCISPCA